MGGVACVTDTNTRRDSREAGASSNRRDAEKHARLSTSRCGDGNETTGGKKQIDQGRRVTMCIECAGKTAECTLAFET